MLGLSNINIIAPFLFVYGKARGNDKFCTYAVNLLENLPAKRNAILAQWEDVDVRNPNVFIPQAPMHLNNEYYKPRQCLHNAIENKIVRK